MKFLTLMTAIFFSMTALSQTVDIGDVDAGGSESTTIEIHKGKKRPHIKKGEAIWEIADGNVDLAGEPANLSKAARRSWKKSCKEWKKEFRRDNKRNRIISINCGIPDCSGRAGNTKCTSSASYKIKTKIN